MRLSDIKSSSLEDICYQLQIFEGIPKLSEKSENLGMVLYEELEKLLKIHKFKRIDFDFEDTSMEPPVIREVDQGGKYEKHLAYEFEHNVLKNNFRPLLGDEPSDQTKFIEEVFRSTDFKIQGKTSIKLDISNRIGNLD